MTIYRLRMELYKEGEPEKILATKNARLYSDDLRVSEDAIHIRAIEIIRDMQYIDNPKIERQDLYPYRFDKVAS